MVIKRAYEEAPNFTKVKDKNFLKNVLNLHKLKGSSSSWKGQELRNWKRKKKQYKLFYS